MDDLGAEFAAMEEQRALIESEVNAFMSDAPDWAQHLYRVERANNIALTSTLETIRNATAEIAPLIADLQNVPMFKMMFGRKS